MADAVAASNQAASAAKMEHAVQPTPPRPPELTPNDALPNSLESHRSVQVLHQRLAQPQAQQPLAPMQQSGTTPHTAGGSMPICQQLCLLLAYCVSCNATLT